MKKLLLTTALVTFATTAIANHDHDGVDYKAQVMELQEQIAEIQEYSAAAIAAANTNQNDQIQALAQYNADLKAEVDATNAANAQLQEDYDWAYGVAVQLQNYGQDVGDVIATYNSNDAKRWFKPSDRAAFVDDLYSFLVSKLDELQARKTDLKRAEDRIRDLEEELHFHKSGGHWNPTNW